jgi:hypothetical protein
MGDRPLIDELRIGDAPEAWRAAGFTVEGDFCRVGTVRLRLGRDGTGITDWTLRNVPATTSAIDDIPTAPSPASSSVPPAEAAIHENGVTRIDHAVLMTPDLPRTTGALVALGLEVRRERDAGTFRQVFFRMGEVILEVVGPHEPGSGPASLWGLTFAVADIDATAAFLGDHLGRVKDAVQPGRRITTLRGRDLGISPAVAFISD